jgi:peptidylprolyl isomerase
MQMKTGLIAAAAALLATAAYAAPKAKAPKAEAAPAIADADWRTVDAENTLVIDTSKGRVFVELQPQAAPAHIERLKKLTRERFYDGLKFHRVIDAFMAQTGDPLGTGEGQSPYEDLKAEFTFRRGAEVTYTPVATPKGSVVGFMGSFPIQTQPDDLMALTADHKVWAWGLYCPGVGGMARGEKEDSANSQFFLMRQSYPSLEKRYTAWGRVVAGLDVVRALKVGEPVVDPDVMTKVQVLADIPEAQRPRVQVLDTRSKAFASMVEKVRADKGADFSICDVDLPSRVR